jgi:nodulation protein E
VRRVAITGIGVVSCYGRGLAPLVDAMREGRSGIRRLEGIDLSRIRCHVGAQIPAGVVESSSADRFTRIALMAAADAMAQSGVAGTIDPARFGTIIGTGLGGCETLDSSYLRFYGENLRVSPVTIPNAMYNAATSAVAIAHQAKGPGYAVVSACASANHAIGLAAQTIAAGQADVMLTGGSDAPLTPGIITAWESMRVLACDAADPAMNSRPFHAARKGIVLAEGAGVFVLEAWDRAVSRGAQILGEIAGFGLSTDATHMTDPSADGAQRAIAMATPRGEVPGYINAHGTGTRANDGIETEAIKRMFGEAARSIPVSSTKSMHGHAMGASGAIELAATLGSLEAEFLPPTINLDDPDPACDLDYVASDSRPTGPISLFLSNSFGFGGMNAVIAVRPGRQD